MGTRSTCCKDNSTNQYQISQLTIKPSVLNIYQNFMSMHPNIHQIMNHHVQSYYQKSYPNNNQNIQQNQRLNIIVNKKNIFTKYKQYQQKDGIFIGKQKVKDGYGIMLYNSNAYYQGEWRQNKKYGEGLFVSQNGLFYYGDWKNDLADGYGVYVSINPKQQYQGGWKQGSKHGKGVQKFEDGSIYTGDYVNGVKEGQGKLVYKDGTSYEGQFKNNVIEGIGIFKGKNHIYEGSWKAGKMHGTGKSQWFNQKGTIIAKYVGQYRDGIKEGFGQYTDSKGVIYKATWINGQINDRGPVITHKQNF